MFPDPCLQRAARTERRIATIHRLRHDRRNFHLSVAAHCLGISSPETAEASTKYFSTTLSPGPGRFEDPIFVCLDTEGCIREIGLCILDTRDLENLDSNSDLSKVSKAYNFIMYRKKNAERYRPFGFGTSIRLHQRWTSWLLIKILTTGSPDPTRTEPRNVILVGHSIENDLKNLARSEQGKFDIMSIPNVPIVDTTSLCRGAWPLKTTYTPGLEELTEWLGIECRDVVWHNAGNDAVATMKVLLRLVVKGRGLGKEVEKRVGVLSGIVRETKAVASTDIDEVEYEKLYGERIGGRFDDWVDACEGDLDVGDLLGE